jgi:hypothetical protein
LLNNRQHKVLDFGYRIFVCIDLLFQLAAKIIQLRRNDVTHDELLAFEVIKKRPFGYSSQCAYFLDERLVIALLGKKRSRAAQYQHLCGSVA